MAPPSRKSPRALDTEAIEYESHSCLLPFPLALAFCCSLLVSLFAIVMGRRGHKIVQNSALVNEIGTLIKQHLETAIKRGRGCRHIISSH